MGRNISNDSISIRERTLVSSLSNRKSKFLASRSSPSHWPVSLLQCTEAADRELLPGKIIRSVVSRAVLMAIVFLGFHDVSVFPKKELPFFILFTAGLCSGTAMLALLTHQYPEIAAYIARLFLTWFSVPLQYLTDKIESILPSNLFQQLAKI